MLTQYFIIPRYNWKVDVYYHINTYYIDEIINNLKNICYNTTIIKDSYNLMAKNKLNVGLTYSNLNKRHSIIVIAKTSTPEEFMNTYCHEVNHLARHIEEKFNIDPYGEESAYLTGDIHQLMFPKAKRFLCNCYSRK